jgi:nucleotide-binding universal stress UspA family protein
MLRFKNILCVIDTRTCSRDVLERAVAVASGNQAALTVVAVAEHAAYGGLPEDLRRDLQRAVQDQLSEIVTPFRDRVSIETDVLAGTPYLATIRDVLANGRDLVIKCAEDPEWLERLLGSDDMHLLRKCPCPVWLTKPGAHAPYRRIAAAVDVDDGYPQAERETRDALNKTVLETAVSLALSEFAELHVAYAWTAVGEDALRHSAFLQRPEDEIEAYVENVRRHQAELLDGLMRGIAAGLDSEAVDYLKPRTHLVKGSARREIPALLRDLDVDLLVLGTVARTGIKGVIMGNTAEAILTQVGCSVLAVKPPGFDCPLSVAE